VKTRDGREIAVPFVADDSEAPVKAYEREALSRTWLWLAELEENCAGRCRYGADETVEQFNCTKCPSLLTVCRVPALENAPTLYCKR
jgi:hypothetical protein